MSNTSLGDALAQLNESDDQGLPVVDRADHERAVGYLSRIRALSAYNKALIDQHVEHHT